MKFLSKYAGAIGIMAIILLFILAKLPDLSLPYFWDELGVYAPGALNMKDTGHFGLLPNCMDPELSRGHPLLSYLGYALFYKFFGDTTTVGHTFTLLLACTTLFSLYLFTKPAFGRLTAWILCIVLAIQPLFFAMAGIIMPEMMLTLFSVWAIGGLVTGRWWLYLAAAIGCVLTKESGIAVPAAAMLYVFTEHLRLRKLFSIRALLELLLCFLPLLVFAGFLLIQKKQLGWYFFPLHTHLMRKDPSVIWWSFKNIVWFIFFSHGRGFITLIMCTGIAASFIKPAGSDLQRKWLAASLFFIVAALGFAAPNYHLVRYILYVLPFSLIIGVWGLSRIAALFPPPQHRMIMIAGGVGSFVAAVWYLSPKTFADNADMSYRFFVQTQSDCIRWAEKQAWSDSTVTANFPVNSALVDQRYGYLKKHKTWKTAIQYPGIQVTKYGIYYWQGGKPPSLRNGMFYELKRFQRNDAIFSVVMSFDN